MMLYSISISLSLSLSYSPIHTSRVFFIIPYFPHFLSCLLLSLFFSHFCPLNLSSPPLSFYSARTDLQLLFLLPLFPKHSLITKSTFVVSFDPSFLFISSTLWLFLPLFLPLFLSLSLSLLLFLFLLLYLCHPLEEEKTHLCRKELRWLLPYRRYKL